MLVAAALLQEKEPNIAACIGGEKKSLIVCVFNNLFCLHRSEVFGLVSELAGFNLFAKLYEIINVFLSTSDFM